MPVCPRCENPAYYKTHCPFCGQRFLSADAKTFKEKLRLWLLHGKSCRKFCPTCEYAYECYEDFFSGTKEGTKSE